MANQKMTKQKSTHAFLFFSLFFAVFLLLSSCLGQVPPSDNAQELESNERLLQAYSGIVGLYEGSLSENPNGEMDVPIQLNIFISYEPAGRNEDGATRFVPVLQAYLKRLDVDDVRRHYFITSVRYYQESGRILMATQEDMRGSVPGVGYLSIQGQILQNGSLRASFVDHRGPQGVLKLERLAKPMDEQ
jgi:hypothetical protein